MEKEVQEQFHDGILQDAIQRFGLEDNQIKLLGDFENYVYEIHDTFSSRNYILRLTHSSHRNEALILGEVDWINFLKKNDVSVAQAYPSINRSLVETIDSTNSSFFATLFEKAQGKIVDMKDSNEWNPIFFENWGQTIGKMHKVTKNYEATHPHYKRLNWDEDDLIHAENYVPLEQTIILDKNKELTQWLYQLPQNRNSFGLIHTDIHPYNFFVHNQQLTIFDFDDSAYNWFISDIAIALYYSVWWSLPGADEYKKNEFAKKFMHHIMEGYERENHMDSYWMKQIPAFLKLREMTLYTVLMKKLDILNMNERDERLLNELRLKIEQDLPVVQF